MKIRPFAMADYEAAARVWADSGADVDTHEQIRFISRRYRDLFLVAEIKQGIIGIGYATWDGRRGSIWRLSVHPDHQRRGVAQALLNELEKRLRDKGATWVYLFTGIENEIAQKLYEKNGYQPLDECITFCKLLVEKRREDTREP